MIQDWLIAAYPWTKALHIVSVISWMAGLFYLPRLFVHHAERAGSRGELHETFRNDGTETSAFDHEPCDGRDLGFRSHACFYARHCRLVSCLALGQMRRRFDHDVVSSLAGFAA